MLHSAVHGIGQYLGFYAVMAGVPLILIRTLTNLPFELTRKLLHDHSAPVSASNGHSHCAILGQVSPL